MRVDQGFRALDNILTTMLTSWEWKNLVKTCSRLRKGGGMSTIVELLREGDRYSMPFWFLWRQLIRKSYQVSQGKVFAGVAESYHSRQCWTIHEPISEYQSENSWASVDDRRFLFRVYHAGVDSVARYLLVARGSIGTGRSICPYW